MNAFIVRPFGPKTYVDATTKASVTVDFDAIDRELIDPVLTRLGIVGRTTGEIVEAGNIVRDMFELLLTRDLVIADVSIHNANVFYELGIRHALRDKRTFLIRFKGDPMPFDNLTERYFEYDRDNPGASVDRLHEALVRTLESPAKDSPVFRSLPDLHAQDPARFVAVPSDFGEEVERAAMARQPGDLSLLALEAQAFTWAVQGLRDVGRAQFGLNAMEAARQTWEAVREADAEDLEANERLGTIFQRLGDLVRSSQALDRVLSHSGLAAYRRAEIQSLVGRNAKTLWQRDWAVQPSEEARRDAALASPFLLKSFEAYDLGFLLDRNHFYSGLNAAGLLTVLTSLARDLTQVWTGAFESDKQAADRLAELEERRAKLVAGVELAFETEQARLDREGEPDIWFEISKADFACLTSQRPQYVANAYRRALTKAQDFHRNSAAQQLLLYEKLGVLPENVRAALGVVAPPVTPGKVRPPRTILFTGHRLDAPGRATPRFPADRETQAREAIEAAVRREHDTEGAEVVGIAGGASGGDILFHEVCQALSIPTTLYLPFPADAFVAASVQDAGPAWVDRFHRLAQRLPTRVLQDSEALPVWLRRRPAYTIWDRNNLWTLQNALVSGGADATVIALWDGGSGDGPGGTQHMVETARHRGARTIVLDTRTIFGTASTGSHVTPNLSDAGGRR
ncbi:MAG: tetratricopeptide repeat-containing protein [Candidatus Rokuibacteriota bacterium]